MKVESKLLSVAAYDTPAFDRTGWPVQVQLAWPILDVRHFSGITRALLLEAGVRLGVTRRAAERILDELVQQMPLQADLLLAELARDNDDILKTQPDLANRLAGEMRCLRVIRYAILPDMVARIGAG
ncbi:MAG: hypothetical protein Q4D91_10095 [Lautropia sp.]|nr:hypothetical protein [Lautropia sp.]